MDLLQLPDRRPAATSFKRVVSHTMRCPHMLWDSEFLPSEQALPQLEMALEASAVAHQGRAYDAADLEPKS